MESIGELVVTNCDGVILVVDVSVPVERIDEIVVDDVVGVDVEQPCIGDGGCEGRVS